jgi:hypothetical protein
MLRLLFLAGSDVVMALVSLNPFLVFPSNGLVVLLRFALPSVSASGSLMEVVLF